MKKFLKKALALVLAVMMVVGVMPAVSLEAKATEDGSTTVYYTIGSSDEGGGSSQKHVYVAVPVPTSATMSSNYQYKATLELQGQNYTSSGCDVVSNLSNNAYLLYDFNIGTIYNESNMPISITLDEGTYLVDNAGNAEIKYANLQEMANSSSEPDVSVAFGTIGETEVYNVTFDYGDATVFVSASESDANTAVYIEGTVCSAGLEFAEVWSDYVTVSGSTVTIPFRVEDNDEDVFKQVPDEVKINSGIYVNLLEQNIDVEEFGLDYTPTAISSVTEFDSDSSTTTVQLSFSREVTLYNSSYLTLATLYDTMSCYNEISTATYDNLEVSGENNNILTVNFTLDNDYLYIPEYMEISAGTFGAYQTADICIDLTGTNCSVTPNPFETAPTATYVKDITGESPVYTVTLTYQNTYTVEGLFSDVDNETYTELHNASDETKTINLTSASCNGNVATLTFNDSKSVLETATSFELFIPCTLFTLTTSSVTVNNCDTTYTLSDSSATSKTAQTLSFENSSINADYGEAISNTLTGANTSVTYESSNTSVATVNETTGEVTIVGVGSTTITATAEENDTYQSGSASYSLTVSVADPTAPTGLTATYGQTLSDVTLPDGWTWVKSTESVGDAGTKTFSANYADETGNYNDASNVSVTVTVSQAAPTITTFPTASAVTAGSNLSTSKLTGGVASVEGSFAWKDGTTTVSTSGNYTVVFTPSDTTNYTTVEFDVAVTVNAVYTVSLANSGSFANGTITVNGAESTSAAAGDTITVAATPADSTYECTSLYYYFDSNSETHYDITNGSFTMPAGAVTVGGTFALKKYTITGIGEYTGGKITADQTSPVEHGTSVTFTVTPNTGYEIKSFSVNGDTKKLTDGQYQLSIEENKTVSAEFEKINYSIYNGGCTNCSISLSPLGTHNYGDTVTVTVTPYPGYKLSSVQIQGYDGTNVTDITSDVNYNSETGQFTMPACTVYIKATCVEKTAQTLTFANGNTINATLGDTVSNELSGAQTTVTYSSSNTSVATVNETTGEVTLTGIGSTTITASAVADAEYAAAQASYTLKVEASAFTVTIADGITNGTVTADKTTEVSPDTTVTLTITPADGYILGDVTILKTSDSSDVTAAVGYSNGTFTMPSYDVTVNATFTENPVQTLTFASDTVKVTWVDTVSNELSGAKTTVTYTSSDTTIATVDSSTGAVTLTGIGSTIITASAAANGTYNAAQATYTLTVEKANPLKSEPTFATVYYGTKLSEVQLDSVTSHVSVTLTWKNPDTMPTVADSNVTEYTAVFTPEDTTHYNIVEKEVTLTIEKANIAYPVTPEGLTGIGGQKLSTVTFADSHWVWLDPDAVLSTSGGTHTYEADYIPDDTANYNGWRRNITVTVISQASLPYVTLDTDNGNLVLNKSASDVDQFFWGYAGETDPGEITTWSGFVSATMNGTKYGFKAQANPADDFTAKVAQKGYYCVLMRYKAGSGYGYKYVTIESANEYAPTVSIVDGYITLNKNGFTVDQFFYGYYIGEAGEAGNVDTWGEFVSATMNGTKYGFKAQANPADDYKVKASRIGDYVVLMRYVTITGYGYAYAYVTSDSECSPSATLKDGYITLNKNGLTVDQFFYGYYTGSGNAGDVDSWSEFVNGTMNGTKYGFVSKANPADDYSVRIAKAGSYLVLMRYVTDLGYEYKYLALTSDKDYTPKVTLENGYITLDKSGLTVDQFFWGYYTGTGNANEVDTWGEFVSATMNGTKYGFKAQANPADDYSVRISDSGTYVVLLRYVINSTYGYKYIAVTSKESYAPTASIDNGIITLNKNGFTVDQFFWGYAGENDVSGVDTWGEFVTATMNGKSYGFKALANPADNYSVKVSDSGNYVVLMRYIVGNEYKYAYITLVSSTDYAPEVSVNGNSIVLNKNGLTVDQFFWGYAGETAPEGVDTWGEFVNATMNGKSYGFKAKANPSDDYTVSSLSNGWYCVLLRYVGSTGYKYVYQTVQVQN